MKNDRKRFIVIQVGNDEDDYRVQDTKTNEEYWDFFSNKSSAEHWANTMNGLTYPDIILAIRGKSEKEIDNLLVVLVLTTRVKPV